ncbi:hypothetical protein [Vreelandella subglaciescola]|jgi:hypothetical protein|uniref:Curlin associated repeat-containing protein n=1 Tax=Vreelandella subglaciescola TaxID=29571 RepID=A0A1M7H8Y3_9GAMM|nr:hypothetical protein [Halomonas subglaciescola]SHM24868.1 Curlin associated repeat-containing protein [Halomonas subglaciescola]
MKMQMTTIAAAVALTVSVSAVAQTAPGSQFNGSRNTVNSMAGPLYDGNAVGSDSYINQTGNSNTNSVTQWGTQISRIKQNGSGNETTVVQDDVVGVAQTAPGQNYSKIDQDGKFNKADVNQLGEQNDSIINQDGNRNNANVAQDGTRNDSWVKQDGNDNVVDVYQHGELNDSYIKFTGDSNSADVFQHGDELDSDILASGNNNMHVVNQTGYGHDSFISTHGSNNTQTVNQAGSFSSSGQHFSQILTNGNGNTNSVYQGN